MINIVKYRYLFYLLSVLVMIPGLIFLFTDGLRLGVDFTGGSLWEVQFREDVPVENVRAALAQAGYANAPVQELGGITGDQQGSRFSIRLPEIAQDSPQKQRLDQLFRQSVGEFTENFSTVGPTVGNEIARRSLLAIGLASLGILAYIAFSFRKVRHPFRYGVCAILAMLHDVVVVVGIFAILGRFFGVEVDALFVTALLTIIGFSVHDTIVVFDRIRENQLRRFGESFENVVNYSLVQTLVRSINTSITVLLTLTALYLFGGITIRNFVLALLIGIFSGTFSSIFVASLLLVSWETGEFGRLFGRGRRAPQPAG